MSQKVRQPKAKYNQVPFSAMRLLCEGESYLKRCVVVLSLRKMGAYQVSQEGSHTKWKHHLVPTALVLSGHDGDDAKPYQEKAVRNRLHQIVKAGKKEI